MASKKSQAEYEQDRLDFIEDMKEDGFLATFKKSDFVGGISTDIEVCSEYALRIDAKDEFPTQVEHGDVALVVSNATNLLEKAETWDGLAIKDREIVNLDNRTTIMTFILCRA